MDELTLDPNKLANIADIIDNYCDVQTLILNEYQTKMLALSDEWDDDVTFGSMLREIFGLKQQAQMLLENCKAQYPGFFREKASQIAGRPIYAHTQEIFGGFTADAPTYTAPPTVSNDSGATSSVPPSVASTSPRASASSVPQSGDRLERGEFRSDGIRPTKLKRTRQVWSNDTYVRVFDSPKETGKLLNSSQGIPKSRGGEGIEGFEGTCGLVSVENVLRMAGVNIDEAKIVEYASTHKPFRYNGERMLCTTGSTPENNGGTYSTDLQVILRHFGIESTIENAEIEKMARFVEEGRGVIVSVDANMLWYQCYGSIQNLHCVTVTSVQRDRTTGEITGIYICDSGDTGASSARLVPFEVMKLALEGGSGEMNVTETIIR